MKMKYLYILALVVGITFACRDDESIEATDNEETTEEEVIVDTETYPDWTDATHSKDAELDYSTVFNQNEVLRFDIKIDSDDWSDMQSDLASNLGGNSRPGQQTTSDFDPIWVPCSFNFNDTEWYHVGIRYKGNSSLQSAYQSGSKKLSFKLDFDEFEDDYPSLKNQRFYGFKQLNLNNNYDDSSLMREKVGADLFRQFGLVASETAFCVVYVDNGSGSEYYGVYALVEEVDDTVIKTQFTDGSGNLYKPDGDAASFANNYYDEDEMKKKTNEDEADYSDVKLLYTIINSSDRTNNTTEWKTNLEAIFNVDGFLKWLAANTVIQNWDTYGNMTHNYYLYNNPETSKLTWIPWDNNEAFQKGKQYGALSLSLDEVNSSWPLISYLIDDDDYKQVYEDYLLQFVNEVFIPSELSDTYTAHYNLIKEYAYQEGSSSSFDSAVETLKAYTQERSDAVTSYLN